MQRREGVVAGARPRLVVGLLAAALAVSGCGARIGQDRAGAPPGGPEIPPMPSVAPATSVAPEPESEADSPPTTATAGTGLPEGMQRVAGVDEAVDVVSSAGYDVDDLGSWTGGGRLRVLIGTAKETAGGYSRLAFFFADGRYLGNDTAEPSLSLEVAAQDGTTVTLRYRLYRASDSLCCPSGGSRKVRFRLRGTRVVPLDPIPPPAGSAGAGR